MMYLPLLPWSDMMRAILFSFLTAGPVQMDSGAPTAKPPATESFQKLVQELGPSERYWSAPYVLADLEAREVLVWGEDTGMIPGDPLEFFVIAENSGHDYEALMISYARPSDIHQALEKIGLVPGGPVNPDVHQFWPRGDRVVASFWHTPPGEGTPVEIPAEAFCQWNGEPMPLMPWVFTGSPSLPSREHEGEQVYAADEFPPNSIASTFNLRATVFDLPLQGTKTGVYGDFLLTPTVDLVDGRPMLLRLRPAAPELVPQVVDLQVRLLKEEIEVAGADDISSTTLDGLQEALAMRPDDVFYLTPDFDGSLTLSDATRRAREVQRLEQTLEPVRIAPPPPGQVFFQSFVPDPKFRDRQRRPSQPVELHVNGSTATAMELEEIWGTSRVPEIRETQHSFETPEDWVAYLEAQKNRKSVLFVYGSPDLTLKEMRVWTEPVLDWFPIVFVYKTGE
jgi:hypothetical protein